MMVITPLAELGSMLGKSKTPIGQDELKVVEVGRFKHGMKDVSGESVRVLCQHDNG